MSDAVALRKESVDRNIIFDCKKKSSIASLSARRAWIEISVTLNSRNEPQVALRKESVDRNFFDVSLNCKGVLSLSARRAWIEIP